MSEIDKNIEILCEQIEESIHIINIDNLKEQLDNLQKQQAAPDFWNDQQKAQKINKQISKINLRIGPWEELHKEISEIKDLSMLDDESIEEELKSQLRGVESKYQSLKQDLLYRGKYDDYDAIVGIYAGAGGTDAQDWAQMLLRMYSRWAESGEGYSYNLIEIISGEEAGIKSATFEIGGPFAYGKLKGEQGVHRLVRLSPFNADNLRQTSFAKVEVMPKIEETSELSIDEKDLKIDVFRAGGHGGQSVNTTDSAVRVTHLPTGIIVKIQNERSQLQNKETALMVLRSHLAKLQIEQHKEKIKDLKGPNEQASWGNQIRSYVLHPYNMVKDLRTRYETSDTQAVLDGNINMFIQKYLESQIGHNN